MPAYDFGDVISNRGNARLVGDAHYISLTLTESLSFTNDWIGGQIIGGGTSDVSPLGYAIITEVSYQGNTAILSGKYRFLSYLMVL